MLDGNWYFKHLDGNYAQLPMESAKPSLVDYCPVSNLGRKHPLIT